MVFGGGGSIKGIFFYFALTSNVIYCPLSSNFPHELLWLHSVHSVSEEKKQRAHLELLSSAPSLLPSPCVALTYSQLDSHLLWKCPVDKYNLTLFLLCLHEYFSYIFRDKDFWQPLPHQFPSDSHEEDALQARSDNGTF